ncbi:MAG TPA: GNAT family N-acetyltransferase [Allosphingosinicella sp.]|nr:GNAT family N-acetyltransferase [Allosphingosinicella sp.]
MFARTDRLLLRPGWREDAPALYAAIAEEGIVRNLATAPWPYSMADAEAFLAIERPADTPSFLLFRRTRGAPQLVGGAGLGRDPGGPVELGYWIARPFWGLGYATEAAEAVIRIARDTLRLDKLVAAHVTDNPASGRVLEKVGFKPTGQYAKRYSAGRRAMVSRKLFEFDLSGSEVAAEEDVADAAMSFEKAFCLAA